MRKIILSLIFTVIINILVTLMCYDFIKRDIILEQKVKLSSLMFELEENNRLPFQDLDITQHDKFLKDCGWEVESVGQELQLVFIAKFGIKSEILSEK